MRTTVDLDESVLSAARAIARDEGVSLGRVLSELARAGLSPPSPLANTSGFPVFAAAHGAAPITLPIVNEHRDGE